MATSKDARQAYSDDVTQRREDHMENLNQLLDEYTANGQTQWTPEQVGSYDKTKTAHEDALNKYVGVL